MRISDWSSDVCSSDLSDFAIDFADLALGRQKRRGLGFVIGRIVLDLAVALLAIFGARRDVDRAVGQLDQRPRQVEDEGAQIRLAVAILIGRDRIELSLGDRYAGAEQHARDAARGISAPGRITVMGGVARLLTTPA